MRGLGIFLGLRATIADGGVGPPPPPPATATWNGGGTTNNFSDVDNWVEGVAPVAGANLYFTSFVGIPRSSPVNDLAADTTFSNITLTAWEGEEEADPPFFVSGNRFILTGNITVVGDEAHTITNAIILNGNLIVSTADMGLYGYSAVTLSGVVSEMGGSRSITKLGRGDLSLFARPNTYSGGTIVEGGLISLTGSGSLGTGAVTVDNQFAERVTIYTGSQGIHTNDFVIEDTVGIAYISSYFSPTQNLSGNIAVHGTLEIHRSADVSVACQANFSGDGTIYFGNSGGTGQFLLNGVNTFSGTIRCGAPIVTAGSVNAWASTVDILVTSGGGIASEYAMGAASITINSNAGGDRKSLQGGIVVSGDVTYVTAGGLIIRAINTSSVHQITVGGTCTFNDTTVNFDDTQNLNAGTYTLITATTMTGTATQGTLPIGRSWVSLGIVGNNLVAVLA